MKPSISNFQARLAGACAAAFLACSPVAFAGPNSPHTLYNDGVDRLAANDLKEAENCLREAVASNHEVVQPAALYNLGHVRFLQGQETLKGEGNRQQLLDSSSAATALAEEVIRRNAPIAERDDVQELIAAYMEARAARKHLRLIREENTRELDLLGSAIERWRRSVGNFRSAAELDPENKDANFNADVVERRIGELLNFKKELEEEQENVAKQREKLMEMMKKMRRKIPKEMQRGSDDEEDDEDEDEEGQGEQQEDPEKDAGKQQQQQQRIGSEREIDPDMLRVLKEKMPQRTMSVGQEGEREMQGLRPESQKPGEPKGRKGRDW